MTNEFDDAIGRAYFEQEGRRQFDGMTPAGWEKMPQELKDRWIRTAKAHITADWLESEEIKEMFYIEQSEDNDASISLLMSRLAAKLRDGE
jgi:hypothetical protein